MIRSTRPPAAWLQTQAKLERLKRHTLRQEVLDVARQERWVAALAIYEGMRVANWLGSEIQSALQVPGCLLACVVDLHIGSVVVVGGCVHRLA